MIPELADSLLGHLEEFRGFPDSDAFRDVWHIGASGSDVTGRLERYRHDRFAWQSQQR